MHLEVIYDALNRICHLLGTLCANNPNGVGPLVEQGWRVKRAYPVYGVQRENKAVGLGLFNSLKLGGWRDRFDLLS